MKYYLDNRGLYCDIIYKVMDGDLRKASPFYCIYDLFISPRDNKRKLKPLNKIDTRNPNKPYISMTEIDFDSTQLNNNKSDDDNKNGNDNDDDNEGSGDSGNGYNYLCRPELDIDKMIKTEKVELNLPSMYLFHGEDDLSCPVSNTKTFSLSLANYGVKTFIKLYPNKSHTAPIIEDPISGRDPLVCDMLQIIYPDLKLNSIIHEIENTMTGGLRLPQFIIDLASFVCPF